MILDFAEILELDLLFFFFVWYTLLCKLFRSRCRDWIISCFRLSEICTPIYCKSYWVSNDTAVKFSKKDLIKLFKDIILHNCKSTAWPLGSSKLSILRLWESKKKKEFTHHILAKLNPPHVNIAPLHFFINIMLISILKLRCLKKQACTKYIFQPQNFFNRFHFFPNQV